MSLPIYRAGMVNAYKGRKCTEMRPHLFSLSDNAYHDMLMGVWGGAEGAEGWAMKIPLPLWLHTY